VLTFSTGFSELAGGSGVAKLRIVALPSTWTSVAVESLSRTCFLSRACFSSSGCSVATAEAEFRTNLNMEGCAAQSRRTSEHTTCPNKDNRYNSIHSNASCINDSAEKIGVRVRDEETLRSRGDKIRFPSRPTRRVQSGGVSIRFNRSLIFDSVATKAA